LIGSLLLQGLTPVLGTPSAGVGGVDGYDRDASVGRHADKPESKLRGGQTSDGAAQAFPALAAAQRFPTGHSGIDEVKGFHYHCLGVVLFGAIKQRGNRSTHPRITARGRQPRGDHLDAGGLADRITRAVEHARGRR
jgi:hypothetical protein